ncbi:MAG: hypothetical protein LBQ35_06530 [Spirochaetaceae bacterium]|jgi:hypothetical protein|nr:hypothetical protein [Spirochaetaceae bacterium]
MTVKRWRPVRDRLLFIRTLAQAILLLTTAVTPLRTEAVETPRMKLASYKVSRGESTRPDILPNLYLVGASYHLQILNRGYQNFIMGCYDSKGACYVWNRNSKKWEPAAGTDAVYLNTLRAEASGDQVQCSRLNEVPASRSSGYEDNLEFTAFREAAAEFNSELASPLENSLVAAPMSGGLSGLPLDGELNFTLALFAAGSSRGDILLFSRPASWFSGEAELFNATGDLRGASYRDRALSLLYEFHKQDSLGPAFEQCMAQYYPGVNLKLFQSDVPGKDEALRNLANALNAAISGQFAHMIRGQKVFDVSRSLPGQPFLYGQNRNIYVDAFLLFYYSQNKPVFEKSGIIENILSFFRRGNALSMRQLSYSEGLDLARFAMRYFTWGMEYSPRIGTPYYYRGQPVNAFVYGDNQIWNKPSYGALKGLPLRAGTDGFSAAGETVRLVNLPSDLTSRLESPFPGGESGYPLPYAEGGTDTPASFAGRVRAAGRNASRTIQAAPSRAGVDGLGFLSGCIAMREGTSTGTVRRLGVEDLERISVILPDLSLVRPGDLVLRFYQAGREDWAVEAAIVAGFKNGETVPDYGIDQRQHMRNILILGPRREIGQVSLAAWAESASGSGPETFHVRRLLTQDGAGQPDESDVQPALMEAEILAMYEQDRKLEQSGSAGGAAAVRERWIPNTGEFLLLPAIEIRATGSAGMNLLDPAAGNMELILSGAIDRFYDAGKSSADYGNIYNNSAGSKFEVALIPETAGDFYRLGVLEYDGAGRYNMNYANSVLYAANSISLADDGFTQNRLWIDGERRLSVRYGGMRYRLGIRPLSLQSARPGDDLILEFALRDKGSADPLRFVQRGSVVEARFQVLPRDYIALYDKKLIWRSNLYINEKQNDWNDVHPWNAPASAASGSVRPSWWAETWGYNEWNQASAPVRNGKQLTDIMGWTHWDSKSPAGDLGYTSVAYGWGSMDSVADFDREMKGQEQAIETYSQNEADQNAENSLSKKPRGTVPGAAPGGEWQNYVFPARRQNTNTGGEKQDDADVVWLYPGDISENQIQQNQQHQYYMSNPRPSVPGLSTHWAFSNPQKNRYHDSQSTVTAGIDCSGFVQKSATYPGNAYELGRVTWRNSTTTIAGESMSREIFGGDWYVTDAKSPIRPESLWFFSLAVPGDILVSAGVHVVLVQDTSPNPEGIVTGRDQVTVIHATQGSLSTPTWNVRKDSGASFVVNITDYKLRRLR